jgi:DNA processing protein
MNQTADRDPDRLARLALATLVEPGNRELGQLVRAIGPVSALGRAMAVAQGRSADGPISDLLSGTIVARCAAANVPVSGKGAVTLAERAMERANRLGVRIVIPEDAEWPTRVEDLVRISRSGGSAIDRDTDPPICLWARGVGAVADVLERSVALVGARAATDYGVHVAADLAHDLAVREWTVVSGGAFGVDAAAHRGALNGGGMTVAVLASGIDRPYPVANASLFERIAEEGLLLSEWPPDSAPHRIRFLTRNRVIAAGTLGPVVVEAAARSGARQTLGRARQLDRQAMAVPGAIVSTMSIGCHLELREPGTRLVTTADEVIEEVGRIGELAPTPRGVVRPHDVLDPLGAQLLDAVLPRRSRTAEEIAAAAGVGGTEARRGLPMLVAAGFVVASERGYRLAPPRTRGDTPGAAGRPPG